jgi:hypothetical protein
VLRYVATVGHRNAHSNAAAMTLQIVLSLMTQTGKKIASQRNLYEGMAHH